MIALLLAAALQARPLLGPCGEPDPCQAAPRAGEVAIVFLGDTGYGQGGSSEWGPHAQGQVAARLAGLCPRPDLVFFLGDNVYWKGSPDLFGPRFDTVYAPLFDAEQRRVHAALGNHDVKGCQLSQQAAYGHGETCADAFVRLVAEDIERDTPPSEGAPGLASPLVVGELLERARGVPRLDCPPAFDHAYEQTDSASTCYATQALRHQPFGYVFRAGNPLRYYSIDHPPAADAAPSASRVRVLVADSNTLRRGPGEPPGHRDERVLEPTTDAPVPPRWDHLQALWLENQLRTADPAAWRIVLMHHPVWTPRGCAFRVFGTCVGGHSDDEAVQQALFPTYQRPGGSATATPEHARHRPDLVMTGHNHFYARSRALDAPGYPSSQPGQGVRYFVTGGGGAPLYRVQPLHDRFAAGGAFHHFIYMRLRRDQAFFWAIDEQGRVRDSGCFTRGEDVDRCIAAGRYEDADLTCGAPAPPTGCPLPR